MRDQASQYEPSEAQTSKGRGQISSSSQWVTTQAEVEVRRPRDECPVLRSVPAQVQDEVRSQDDKSSRGSQELSTATRRSGSPFHVRYKAPAVPRYKRGGDWPCFVSEFRDMVRMAQLSPEYQITYLKQAIPDEAKKLLIAKPDLTLDAALELLSSLFDSPKDVVSRQRELSNIVQRPGEHLRILAGRIEEAAQRYGEAVGSLNQKHLDKLIQAQFRTAVEDAQTRAFLSWEGREMSLEELVQKAQTFQEDQSIKGRKALKVDEEGGEVQQLKKRLAEMEEKFNRLKMESNREPKTELKRPKEKMCWNCGQRGHISRECPEEKRGDGLSYRKKFPYRPFKQRSTQSENTKPEKNF